MACGSEEHDMLAVWTVRERPAVFAAWLVVEKGLLFVLAVWPVVEECLMCW